MVGDLNGNSRYFTQGWQNGVSAFFWGLGLLLREIKLRTQLIWYAPLIATMPSLVYIIATRMVQALARLNFPGLIVNGVSIVPGCPEVHVAASALGGTIGKLIDGDLIRFDLR